jgi:hypothetical protein
MLTKSYGLVGKLSFNVVLVGLAEKETLFKP